MSWFSSQFPNQVFPKLSKLYRDRLSIYQKAEAQKIREFDDATIKETVAILKNDLERFMLTKSLIEKVSILEEVCFWLQFEFTNKHGDYDFARANLVLKMAVTEMGQLFELLVNFKLTMDYVNETKTLFLADEFFTDFDISLNSMLNF